MQTAAPTTVGGKPGGVGYYQRAASFFSEIKQRLENPIPAVTLLGSPASGGILNLSGAFSAASAIIAGALSAASLTTAEGDVRHGDRTLIVPSAMLAMSSATTSAPTIGSAAISAIVATWGGFTGAGAFAYFPIPLCAGDRIKAVTVYANVVSTAGKTVKVFKSGAVDTSGSTTQIGSTATFTTTTGIQSVLISGLTEVLAIGQQYWIEVGFSTAGTYRIGWAEITYDHP